jgi:cysteine desulfurase/selenocysteine lyase
VKKGSDPSFTPPSDLPVAAAAFEDFGKILDREGIAVRAGHHCAQPTLARFGLTATVRPSLALYNTHGEIDLLAESIRRALR